MSKYGRMLSFISLLLLPALIKGQEDNKAADEIARQSHYATQLCRKLHEYPELSFRETETARLMAEELEQSGFTVTRNFGGNNVVGILKNGEGPVVMLRTDMDALPVEEKTGLAFASKRKAMNSEGNEVPVMHACGHDIHMSVWTGTLRTLVSLKERWKGTLLVIAQQAEEMGSGSDEAIEQGLFRKFPVPACAMAFHINPELASGTVGLTGGPVFSGVKTAEILVRGKGGHGAYPEKCIDPIIIASRIVLDLQTIVSREVSPLEPVVVTVGSIHGGNRPNIIPEEVKLELTLRYYNESVIQKVISSVRRISKTAAQMAGMPDDRLPEVKILPDETPPVLNDPALSMVIQKYTEASIGPENVIRVNPAMVAEDFGKYGLTPEKVPICLMWLGSTNPDLLKELKQKGEEPAPIHSPRLFPDYEKTIETGIHVMTSNVLGIMNAAPGKNSRK